MPELIFEKGPHIYTLDGEELPSVTELTRFLSREVYNDAPPALTSAAAERGSRVHEATELLDKVGSAEVSSSIAPYLRAYAKFRKEHKVEWEQIEWSVHNEALYAGTIDRYGSVEGKKVIVDIKTTENISKGHRILYTAALNLYRKAIQSDFAVEALYILQLKKDGNYRLIQLEIQDELADICLRLHQLFKKNKRKGKSTNA